MTICVTLFTCCLADRTDVATVISAKRLFQVTMKVRIANELPNVPIGLVKLPGKVLVSPEDKVGFTMYDFTLQPEDDFSFTAIYPDQNHIYYCVEGTVTSISEYSCIHIDP